jgi:hypothetical protein
MNTYKKPRGNKAKRDKDSILADAKNLLYVLYGCIQRMPKIERIEGAPMEMKRAVSGIVESFTVAKECPEVRLQEIHKMFGCYGRLLASFDLCIVQGLITDSDKVRIATILERIDEGIKKWRNASRTLNRQEQQQVSVSHEVSAVGIQSEQTRTV